ncbi:MAG: phenylalanine--tRNA ligase subunit beta [Gammaproteobacteria bacterium]|nr:phenylalanine--tRNA ligase subunit beta [Gammaproteobacteria bacterium]
MKFSEQWLRQWVNPALTTEQLTEQMAMLGLTVDAITPVAGKFSGVVIGEIVTRAQHPNADKLSCCEVNVGEKELLKIVCGAPNARAGIKVAVATVGAVLPGDFKIKEAKLRGELSQGMLCSAKELQLEMGKSLIDGIIELPADAKIGDDFNDYFKSNDCIIDVDITPNRGDALSIRGVARDLAAAIQGSAIKHQESVKITPITSSQSSLSISIQAPEDCPRYVGRVIRHVNNTLQTPSYMQHALQRANTRLINPVVDITNYVMLELGQPMHAFDLSTIKNNIIVRRAKSNEKIKLLDEQFITLTENDLIIADEEKPLALAGAMGGVDSSVTTNTKDIFLEACFFLPKTVCLSKRRHSITSDGSHRFERGVDFSLPREAIERATQLILEIAGGTVEEIIEVVSENNLPRREAIFLARDQIQRTVGIVIADNHVVRILESLGFIVESLENGWEVIPPSFRFDVSLPVDLIEELARMTGYDTIPSLEMVANLSMKSHAEGKLSDKKIRHFLIDRDYHEAITYSFISPELFSLFSPAAKPITLKNPLSQDMSVMRDSLLPGLLQAVQLNLRHQCERVRLFETGLCFSGDAQTPKLAMVITGSVVSEQWGEKKRAVDFYDLKADIQALLFDHTVAVASVSMHANESLVNTALHPGRSCSLMRDGKLIGYLGEVHPQILNHFDIRQPVIVCELDLEAIKRISVPHYETFSRFPSVRRDLAIVVDEATSAAAISTLVKQQAGSQLQDVMIFDVYQGKNIELGKKSIALGLTFQDPSRTLVDEEINAIIHGVVIALERELNATLRA